MSIESTDTQRTPEQSPGWEKFKDIAEGTWVEEGFPFKERFPRNHNGGWTRPKAYDLILRDGTRRLAIVETAWEYTDGLEWRMVDGDPFKPSEFIVIAWREQPAVQVELSLTGTLRSVRRIETNVESPGL